jgi:ATP-binding cassette subfamily B protein
MSKSQVRSNVWLTLKNTPKLLKLVWQASPGWLIATIVTTLLASILPVLFLYINKLILDWITSSVGQAQVNWNHIILLISIQIFVAIGKNSLAQFSAHVSQTLTNQFSLFVNRKLLEKTIELDLFYYESPEFYEALSRAQQSGSSYPIKALGNLTKLAGQCATLFGLLLLLLSFNPLFIVLLSFSSIPILKSGIKFSNQRFVLNRKQTLNGKLASYFQGLLTNKSFAKEIRLLNLGEYFLKKWDQLYDLNNQEIETLSLKSIQERTLIGILPTLGFYVAFAWTVFEAVRGNITIGDFTMYSGAFSQSQGLLEGIFQNLSSTYESNLFLSEYFYFLSLKPTVTSPEKGLSFPLPIREGLVLENVSFRYLPGQKPVLSHLNLHVSPGESIAIVGVNGSGKTTLVKLLTRLYDPDTGRITVDNIPLQEFDLQDLHRNIAVLFQDFARYQLTVRENIGFGDLNKLEDIDCIQQAIAQAGATDLVASLKQGYETPLGNLLKGGQDLSGGQWQKIGLARTFLSQAQILILDEPTAAMDAIAEYELFERFRQLTQGKITFFISHRFSSVRLADRIVVLDHNEIVELGTHEELMKNNALYAKMFRLQAEGYQNI